MITYIIQKVNVCIGSKKAMIRAMETVLNATKKASLKGLYSQLKLPYHYLLAFLGALLYRFPSEKTKVIAVTGTKGKSSVVELVNAILEEACFQTAVLSTIRFKVAGKN